MEEKKLVYTSVLSLFRHISPFSTCLAVVFVFAGSTHADEQHGVVVESHVREVGCFLGRGGDVVLDTGSAFYREELGSWRGSPEKQRHAMDCLYIAYTTSLMSDPVR